VTLGFIGLGDMGLPMTRRLLAAGNRVVIWNRSQTKLDSLIAEGAIPADSPADVMLQADLIGLCVTSHDVVEQIAWGPSGLFTSPLRGRKLLADFSTGSPNSASAFAGRAKTYGASWVDAPVSRRSARSDMRMCLATWMRSATAATLVVNIRRPATR
jgi:3-hydroxyisobutyrate dehydrogenase